MTADDFLTEIENLVVNGNWSKDYLVRLFKRLVPEFLHLETGKYLDERM